MELELRGNSQTGVLKLPQALRGLGQLTLLRFTDVLLDVGQSAVTQLTALVELSIVAPAGRTAGRHQRPPAIARPVAVVPSATPAIDAASAAQQPVVGAAAAEAV